MRLLPLPTVWGRVPSTATSRQFSCLTSGLLISKRQREDNFPHKDGMQLLMNHQTRTQCIPKKLTTNDANASPQPAVPTATRKAMPGTRFSSNSNSSISSLICSSNHKNHQSITPQLEKENRSDHLDDVFNSERFLNVRSSTSSYPQNILTHPPTVQQKDFEFFLSEEKDLSQRFNAHSSSFSPKLLKSNLTIDYLETLFATSSSPMLTKLFIPPCIRKMFTAGIDPPRVVLSAMVPLQTAKAFALSLPAANGSNCSCDSSTIYRKKHTDSRVNDFQSFQDSNNSTISNLDRFFTCVEGNWNCKEWTSDFVQMTVVIELDRPLHTLGKDTMKALSNAIKTGVDGAAIIVPEFEESFATIMDAVRQLSSTH
eukprot:GDKJ01009190.1.p1 GENE.GDKJ01009190.1~~GDKJ01009190.1.p1  ORF type:complete len:378 (-),score=77.83 GDKJ01009190.1:39-1148(-)